MCCGACSLRDLHKGREDGVRSVGCIDFKVVLRESALRLLLLYQVASSEPDDEGNENCNPD